MPLPGSSVDVPCSLFSGLNTELSPSDLPEGVSPSNQDVAFLPGSVFTRPAAKRLFSSVVPLGGFTLPGVSYFKTFAPDDGATLSFPPQSILIDTAGYWWQELLSNPGTLTQQYSLIPSGAKVQSATAFSREFLAISDGVHGLARPLQYGENGWRRVSCDGPGSAPGVLDSVTAGSVTAGAHQVVYMFLTDTGYLTAPSPPATWTAAGGKKVTVQNIATGPSNVIARVFAFTGSGGDNFFTILENVTFPTAVNALVIFDNTTTTATFDFSDTALFAATAIDTPGNNLFEVVPISPCIGFFSYASRLFCWGELNRVENFRNMSLSGGQNTNGVTGWGNTTAGGQLVEAGTGSLSAITGTIPTDQFWVMTGDGSQNNKGQLQQTCYRDVYGIEILQAKGFYSFYCTAVKTSGSTAGSLVADIYSASGGGQLSQAIIPLSSIGTNAAGMVSAKFNNQLPATIPSDAVLRIYTTGTASGQNVGVSEMSVVFSDNPYRTYARGSYVANPETFDAVTGPIGPSVDPSPVRDMFILRDTLYMLTADRLHETQDDGSSEPSGWTIRQVADKCGSFGVHASSGGEDWRTWAGPTGLRIFEGQYPWKISQEIQTKWDAINLAAQQNVWTVNDPVTRRIYTGVPTGINTTPNQIYVLDYRELDTAGDIGRGATIHISFTGKMIASDLARKWTVWNLSSNYADILKRSGNQTQFCIGGPYGNIHYFSPNFYTDDDYGKIASVYCSYFFINHEAEQMLGVGSHRKLYTYLTAYISGLGNLKITPEVNALGVGAIATYPTIALSSAPTHDLEMPINVLGERVAFTFSVSPITGTDNYFNLQKMVVKLRESPWDPIRGAL